jgi:chloride channel 7
MPAMSFFLVFSMVLATAAAMMTVFIAPKAAGSGMPELIGCMNGIDISSYLTPQVLIVKTIAVVMAIAGTLVLGREGPLAHIGAAVAIMVLFAPQKLFGFDEFKTNQTYREFVLAGITAGVSVAFGAPMGATLFAYEISSPATFWSFGMIWRNFVCAVVATFSLGALFAFKSNAPITLSSQAVLKFGDTTSPTQAEFPLLQAIVAALVIGVTAGFFGITFAHITQFTSKMRKQFVNQNW